MYFNGTLPLDVPLDAPLGAQYVYALSSQCSDVLVFLKFYKMLVSSRFCEVCAQ